MNKDSIWPPYFKDFLIQDSGAKDSNAFCVDDGMVASAERSGRLLLTVDDDGDTLLFHTDSDTMPSVQRGSRGSEIQQECLSKPSDPFKNHINI